MSQTGDETRPSVRHAAPNAERQGDAGAVFAQEGEKGLLKFLTCGSVDDGKSTLIGRLLYDCQLIMEDQLATLESDSRKIGTTGGDLDMALLVDGLQAEREQGITIDVAYRYFTSPQRKFIVADTPGHEQYTRNMATGASACDLAVILVDARKGVLTQTRRHSCIVHLLGIRHVVLAVNKMDQVDYAKERFEAIREEYLGFAEALGIAEITCIPVSALHGDNVANVSHKMDWYHGPSLLAHLETVEVGDAIVDKALRFPVQWVNRPNHEFRGYAGTIVSGRVKVGDEIIVVPSGRLSRVARIVTYDGELESAAAGDAVTLVLADEIDISRGDVIASREARPEIADQVAANVVWMGDEAMHPGRPYLIKCGTRWVSGTVSSLKHKLNVDNLDHMAGRDLELNEVGFCNLSFDRPIAFDPYKENRATGGFIIVDRISNATVGAGMLEFGLRRATNIHWQALDINKGTRAAQKGQRASCIWFTGLSGSGKSTIANLLEKRLHDAGKHTYILDGDNVRHGLNRDLGFTDTDRVENIRRITEVARLMVDAGLIVVVSFISPFRAERRMARELFDESEFLEVFVDTPIEVCEARDPKGLYKKARQGELKNFTGVDSDYELPENAEVVLKGGENTPEQSIELLLEKLRADGTI